MKTFEFETVNGLSSVVLDKIYGVRLEHNVVYVEYEVRNVTFTYIDDETAEEAYEAIIKAIEDKPIRTQSTGPR